MFRQKRGYQFLRHKDYNLSQWGKPKIMDHQHKIKYEFEDGRFSRGWRGDSWCEACPYAVFSREQMRMEMFNLASVLNPPQKHDKEGNTTDSAMFKTGKFKVWVP